MILKCHAGTALCAAGVFTVSFKDKFKHQLRNTIVYPWIDNLEQPLAVLGSQTVP